MPPQLSQMLEQGWELARAPAGACLRPEQLQAQAMQWRPARVPGTAASSLHESVEAAVRAGIDYDADDWWYRCRFGAPDLPPSTRHHLRFEGLATLAEVWLNGESILASHNMFTPQRVDITTLLRRDNTLVIALRSLKAELAARRPRPRWKTALVEQQNLRWFRTTLLGRIPAWSPPVAPVGPWRPVILETTTGPDLQILDLQSRAEHGAGLVKIKAVISGTNEKIGAARLRVGDKVYPLIVTAGAEVQVSGDFSIPDVPLWWPHTHGKPALLQTAMEVQVGNDWLRHDCGRIGFKQVEWREDANAARLLVNGQPVFCRGACWMPVDLLGLGADEAVLRRALLTARDAGVNMLRVGGITVYESDGFYRLCDELGILVWQDLMFANMDYPVADPGFCAGIATELERLLDRLQRRACVAVYCGGSEVAQQAAMLGLPAADWSNAFCTQTAPERCAARHAGIPWFPSSPWGGALPFHVGTGISHYYGVGAYRRPLSDAKTARVKFTTECLGFSNVPDAAATEALLGGRLPPPHHPRWKERVPRDAGAGWDFEDVRDHYLEALFDLDATQLRSTDPARYLALSRVVSGELMRRTYAEWRRPGSSCGGALVWFYRDLWPGAGWGVCASDGNPKPALWYLKRAWAPQSIHFTDEGLDGLAMHLLNESGDALEARVEFALYQRGRNAIAAAEHTLSLPPRGATTLAGDALLGYFSDAAYAYRFGPPQHDVAAARLVRRVDGLVLSEDFYFPAGMTLREQRAQGVQCRVERIDESRVMMKLASEVFLQAVSVSARGWLPEDNYFHVAPGREKTLLWRAEAPEGAAGGRFAAELQALNVPDVIDVRLERA
jgi:beta-mannosidase